MILTTGTGNLYQVKILLLQVLNYFTVIYRAGFKLGGHIFEKGIFSVLYKHKLPRIFIGFSKVLKYVNF